MSETTSPQMEHFQEEVSEDFFRVEKKLIPGLKLLEINVSKLQKNNENLMSENKNVRDILAPRMEISGNGQPEDLEKVLQKLQLKFSEFEGMNSEREQEKEKIIEEKKQAVQALKIYTDKNPISESQLNSTALVKKIFAVKNLASNLNDFIKSQIKTKP